MSCLEAMRDARSIQDDPLIRGTDAIVPSTTGTAVPPDGQFNRGNTR